jgi:hypothetical protein
MCDISQRSVRRAFSEGCPFAAGEFAFEAVEHSVEQFHLSFVQRNAC